MFAAPLASLLILSPLLAGLPTGPVSNAISAPQQKPHKEKESGHLYKIQTKVLGGDKTLEVTGAGIREKTIFNVNVYSYALYVDAALAREKLAKWKGTAVKKLQKDAAFYSALCSDGILKELQLTFCRKVDADDVRSAFEDSLEPRVLAYLKDKPGTKHEKLAILRDFRKLFSVDKVRKGHVLRFAWHPGGVLHTSINGVKQKTLTSEALCWSLFDIYLGKKPISKSGKKKLITRLPGILDK